MKKDECCGVLVAAVGNADRGDDGVGPAIAGRLRGRVPADVRVVECGGNILELIDEWAEVAAVVLVDASNPAGEAGRIRRVDLVVEPLPADFSQNSTHAFGLAETVELARALGQLPGRLVAYLVEGAQFEVGAPLSPSVAAAVERGTETILAEVSTMVLGKVD
jgi:hydrogenase maturation protease